LKKNLKTKDLEHKSIFSQLKNGITSNIKGALSLIGKGLFGSSDKDDYNK
jgi:hypothetical protein